MISTNNFNPKTDPKILCTCGHPLCDKRSVNQYSLDNLQRIREDLGLPMVVSSGGRCPYHPDEAKKVQPGDHQKCYAIDILCSNEIMETKLKVLAGRHGATRVAGNYEVGFVHIAWTPTEDKSVPSWVY